VRNSQETTSHAALQALLRKPASTWALPSPSMWQACLTWCNLRQGVSCHASSLQVMHPPCRSCILPAGHASSLQVMHHPCRSLSCIIPASPSPYASSLQVLVGNRVITYRLRIDTEPPSVASSLVWVNQLPSNIDPNAASSIQDTFVPVLHAWLNFSKPIRTLSKVCAQITVYTAGLEP